MLHQPDVPMPVPVITCCSKDDDSSWESWDDGHRDRELFFDGGHIENSEDEMVEQNNLTVKKKSHQFCFPPSIAEVEKAYADLSTILKPHRKGYGYKDPGLDRIVTEQLLAMKLFCYNYTTIQKTRNSPKWQATSLTTANSLRGTTYMARNLHKWTRAFIADPEFVPKHHQKGRSGHSHINDEDFVQELHLHLQTVGEYCTTEDIVCYVSDPEILAKLNWTKTISHAMAHQWMKKIGYWWRAHPHGQYTDGHERSDVVEYRDKIFLPAVEKLETRTRKWGCDGQEEETPPQGCRCVVFWYV